MSDGDSLAADILALLKARETELRSEMLRVREMRRMLVPDAGGLAQETADDTGAPPAAATPRPRRHMSAAARKRISLAQKAIWRARRRSKT